MELTPAKLSAAELQVKTRLDQEARIKRFNALAKEFTLNLDVVCSYRQSRKRPVQTQKV